MFSCRLRQETNYTAFEYFFQVFSQVNSTLSKTHSRNIPVSSLNWSFQKLIKHGWIHCRKEWQELFSDKDSSSQLLGRTLRYLSAHSFYRTDDFLVHDSGSDDTDPVKFLDGGNLDFLESNTTSHAERKGNSDGLLPYGMKSWNQISGSFWRAETAELLLATRQRVPQFWKTFINALQLFGTKENVNTNRRWTNGRFLLNYESLHNLVPNRYLLT